MVNVKPQNKALQLTADSLFSKAAAGYCRSAAISSIGEEEKNEQLEIFTQTSWNGSGGHAHGRMHTAG